MTDSAADGAESAIEGDLAGAATGGAPRRRARVVLAVIVVLLLVVVAARGTDGTVVQEVLAIPADGSVRPELLGNGTPVFVVHTDSLEDGGDGVVDVIQAFTTEVEGPVTELVGWCAASQQFVAGHHGPLYDVRGRRVPAATSGRLPADAVRTGLDSLDDLVHRTSEAIADRTAEGEPLRIGGIQRLQPWQVDQRPRLQPTVPPPSCRVGADEPTVLHHGFLAGRINPAAAGWQITSGWLAVDLEGRATWCDEEPVVAASGAAWNATCGAPREDLSIGFAYEPVDVGAVGAVLGGPLAVRMGEGVIGRVAVLPSSTWEGSSLR